MPKFLLQGTYTAEGVKGLIKDGGTTRRAAVERLIASAGGTLESIYWAFGDDDVYVTADLPDSVAASAVSLAVAAVGALRIRTVVLLTAEEIDQAAGRSLDYRPPGG